MNFVKLTLHIFRAIGGGEDDGGYRSFHPDS
jgi:hypothetical protein